MGFHPMVLLKAGSKVFAVNPENWSENSHHFLKRCVNVDNMDACYTLGMIQFYCLGNRRSGVSLIAKAAMKLHAPALYSLALIKFNGSGGTKQDKNLHAGVELSKRTSLLSHINAIRELGHCLQEGYGVKKNVTEGQLLLAHAYLTVAEAEVHPVNLCLREWFESGLGVVVEDGLRLCGYKGCGSAETWPHEFRRCSDCGKVNYCSRGCQSMDWKLGHKMQCWPIDMNDILI